MIIAAAPGSHASMNFARCSRKSGMICSCNVYHPFFHQTDRLIKNHGDDAQENDRQDHPVKFEDLAAVNNEKSQSLPGSDKFTDDHTNQTEPVLTFITLSR